MKKESVKNRLRFVSPVALFFVFTFIFYGPLSLFLPNAQELWFSLGSVLKIIVPMSAAFMVVLVGVGAILPQKLRSYYITLMLGGSLAVYIQGNFLKSDYGVLDGTSIDWDSYKSYAILNTAIWIVCIILPFVARIFLKKSKDKDFTLKIFVYAALFLTAIQVPALISQAVSYEPNSQGNLTVTKECEFELSDKENTVIIMLDTFDQKYYEACLESMPELKENLSGFTEYTDATSAAARTIVAIPAMYTGKPFLRNESYAEYTSKVWSEENCLSVLHDNNFDVRFFAGTSYFSADVANYLDNCTSEYSVGSYSTLMRKLYKLTLFRFTPHLLKQYVYTNTSEFDEAKAEITYKVDDATFYSELDENGLTTSSSYDKAVRIYLLNGAHSPYKIGSDGKISSEATLETQCEAAMTHVLTYLNEMKRLGIYESSNIIITADHGGEGNCIHPLFLYKAAGESEGYETTTAPVSTFDISIYLASLAGVKLDDQDYGEDFTLLKDGDGRTRFFYYNSSDNCIPQMNEYIYENGKSRLVNSYKADTTRTEYVSGTVLSFQMEASAAPYCVDGFGNNSGFNTSVRGPYVCMEIPFANPNDQKSYTATFSTYSDVHMSKYAIVSANDTVIFEGELSEVSDGKTITFDIPAGIITEENSTLTLELKFPNVDISEMEKNARNRPIQIEATALVISEN